MSNYKLIVSNNSHQTGNICIYSTMPDEKISSNLMSLAWLSKRTHPNTKVAFNWALDYSFVWAQSGKLTAGVTYEASEEVATDPSLGDANAPNRIYFDKIDGAYKFYADPQGKTSRQGLMSIHTGANVEEGKVGIGLAIGGNPALVVGGTPNFDFTFLPNIKYWIAFGNFEKGEVLDLNAMTNVHEVCFEVNEFEKVINLRADNTWEEIK